MSWERDRRIISWCIQKKKLDEADGLYAKIPWILRTELHSFINRVHWAQIAEECMENPASVSIKANKAYTDLHKQMDEYIENETVNAAYTSSFASDIGTLMVLAKTQVLREFGQDGAAFVKEMASTIAKEKELIYRFSVDPDDSAVVQIDLEAEDSEIRKQYLAVFEDVPKDIGSLKKVIEQLKSLDVTQYEDLLGSDVELESFTRDIQNISNTEIFREMQVVNEPTMLTKAVEVLGAVMEKLRQAMTGLELEVKDWQRAEALASVKTGKHRKLDPLKDDFFQMGSFLCQLYELMFEDNVLQRLCQGLTEGELNAGHLGTFNKSLEDIRNHFFQCNLVVNVQPKDVISILNDNESKKKEGETKDKKPAKKKGPNSKEQEPEKKVYKTKKRQGVNTTVLLLGAEAFQDLRVLDTKIFIVSDDDLAREQRGHNPDSQEDRKPESQRKLYGLPKKSADYSREVFIEWPDIVIEFSREQANHVAEQFFRFRYEVLIEVQQTQITLKTMSLPFNFNTGANQQLVHIGCRMWYCTNVDMYKGSFDVPKVLPADDVMEMLNKRIMCATSRPRPLSEEDKNFLKTKLKVSSDNCISLQKFKEKMDATQGNDVKDQVPFCVWFLGVVNAISSPPLSTAWEDGIIYGFCDSEHAKMTLMKEGIPGRTVLFRPSTFRMEKPSSKTATTALIMEAKLPTGNEDFGDGYEVMPIPLFVSFIKDNGLHRTVTGVKRDNKSVAKYLAGANGSVKKMVSALMKYGAGERKPVVHSGYDTMVAKVEELHVEFRDEEHMKKRAEARAEEGVKKVRASKRTHSEKSMSPEADTNPPSSSFSYTDDSQSSVQTFTVLQTPGMMGQNMQTVSEYNSQQPLYEEKPKVNQPLHYTDLVSVPVTGFASTQPTMMEVGMGYNNSSLQSPGGSSGFSSGDSPEVYNNPESPQGPCYKPLVLIPHFESAQTQSSSGSFESTTIPSSIFLQHHSAVPANEASNPRFSVSTEPQDMKGNIPNVLHLATEPGRGKRGNGRQTAGKKSLKNGIRPQPNVPCSTSTPQWRNGSGERAGPHPTFTLIHHQQLQELQQKPQQQQQHNLSTMQKHQGFNHFDQLPPKPVELPADLVLSPKAIHDLRRLQGQGSVEEDREMLLDDLVAALKADEKKVGKVIVESLPQVSSTSLGMFTGIELSTTSAADNSLTQTALLDMGNDPFITS